jgi:hypothetical protein
MPVDAPTRFEDNTFQASKTGPKERRRAPGYALWYFRISRQHRKCANADADGEAPSRLKLTLSQPGAAHAKTKPGAGNDNGGWL